MKTTTKKKKITKLDLVKHTETVNNEKYKISIKIFGRQYESEGSTLKEAFDNLKVSGRVGGVCVISVSKGDVTKSKILNSRQLTSLFTPSRVMREVSLKNMLSIFSNI